MGAGNAGREAQTETHPDDIEAGRPELSVVVTVVDGGEVLDRHLAALTNQEGTREIEIIVPYDFHSKDTAALSGDYPGVSIVDLGRIQEAAPPNPLKEHAHYDVRRTEGLKRAKGRLIAILEDRGTPKPDWALSMIGLHENHSAGAVGGAITNGIDLPRNWAIFFCDFGRYHPPLSAIDPEYISDTNVCYKTNSLMSVKHIWETAYHEPLVNTAIRQAGDGLLMSDRAVVRQERTGLRLGSLLSERFHWGRVFGRIRGGEISRMRCPSLGVLTPVLPVILFVRHLRCQLEKSHHVDKFIFACPLMVLFPVFWSLGECFGYLEVVAGRAESAGPAKRGKSS